MSNLIRHDLRCGMPAFFEPISGVRSVGLTWLLPAGSATDPENFIGISTLWCELIQRGAGDRDSRQHADALDRLGVSRSVSAGTRHLQIQATMPGDRLAEALPLLGDMALRPRMDADAIEPTRDLALQALESLRDDPQDRAVLGARDRHRPAPFNRSGLGTEEGLRAITRDDLVSGWAERARPVGSVIGLAGDLDPEPIRELLDELLADWSGRYDLPGVTGNPPRGYAHELDDSNQVQIVMVQDAPEEGSDDRAHERIISSVLSGGMSGRLFTEIREKRGLCYAVQSSYRTDRDWGVISSYVGTTPERAQESLDVLCSELGRIGEPEGQVTVDEFDRAVVGMKSRLVFSGESTLARSSALTSDFVKLGRVRSLDEITDEIDASTLDGVNEYALRRTTGTPTIQTLGPDPLTPPA